MYENWLRMSSSGTIITQQTIRNILHHVNIRERSFQKKINVTVKQIDSKAFAKTYVNKPSLETRNLRATVKYGMIS